MAMQFEDILSRVGGYGMYQKCLTTVFLIPVSCILSWIRLDGLFIMSVPEHWCYVEDVANSNLSISEQRTLVSPPDDPSCSMYDVNYTEYMDRNFGFSNDTNVIPCSSGWQFDDTYYDYTASMKWNLVCDRRYLPSLVLTLQNVGSLILSPIYGILGDMYGRKRVYLVLAVLLPATGIASVLVHDFTAFVVLKTIRGSVLPTMFTLAFILNLEMVDPKMRAYLNCISTVSWTSGLSLLILVAYLSRNWIILSLVFGFASASNVIYCWYIPESPSWLVLRGRYEEATTILEQIGKKNGKPQNRTRLFQQLQTLGTLKKKEMSQSTPSLSTFKNPRIRKHFLILCFCRIAFCTTYYGPMHNLSNLAGNEFVNFFLLNIVEIPGCFLFWYLLNRAGRRWTASIGYTLLGIACLGPLTGFQYGDIIFSMIGKLITIGLFMVTEQQSTELFPTVSRTFTSNLIKIIGNLVTMVIPFFADLGAYGKDMPFIIMGFLSIVAGILASFLPETWNGNLPQTVSDAEELGKDPPFFSWKRRKNPITCNVSLTEETMSSKPCHEPFTESLGDPNAALSPEDDETSI